MYIMKLMPALKDNIWGGTRLKTEYKMQTDLDIVAEAWTLSCHKDGPNTVENGEYAGQIFHDVVENAGREKTAGTKAAAYPDFPLLIKLIDAKDDLSIQVHPDDEYARVHEHEFGKTEMWYVIDAQPGASLIYGFKDKISKEEFKAAIENNTLPEVLNSVPVKKGDVFFIEAGTVHAIGKGVFIAEIQQNSNSTYRVYDYGRLGKDGKPRELHVQKALDTAKTEPPKYPTTAQGSPENVPGGQKTLLRSCELFTVYHCALNGAMAFTADEASFVNVLVLDGSGQIGDMDFQKGDSFFVPANFGKFEVNGQAELIVTTM